MSWFSRKSQPKDERPPLQGYGEQLEGSTGENLPVSPYTGEPYDPAWGYRTGGGQSNRALLKLMKSLEESIPSDPPQGGSVIARGPRANPDIITSYDDPPRPRVDPDLIGKYYQ